MGRAVVDAASLPPGANAVRITEPEVRSVCIPWTDDPIWSDKRPAFGYVEVALDREAEVAGQRVVFGADAAIGPGIVFYRVEGALA